MSLSNFALEIKHNGLVFCQTVLLYVKTRHIGGDGKSISGEKEEKLLIC